MLETEDLICFMNNPDGPLLDYELYLLPSGDFRAIMITGNEGQRIDACVLSRRLPTEHARAIAVIIKT